MEIVNNWISQVRTRIGAMSRPQRFTATLLSLAVVGLGVWLVASNWASPLVPLVKDGATPAELSAAQAALQTRGISSQLRSNQLLVRADQLEQAYSVLAYEKLQGRDSSGGFDQVAQEDDIWRTSEQNSKRWQAAKMTTLGRRIATFPHVRSATVILEAGAPRGLGHNAEPPTAAVMVNLQEGQKMNGRLVEAIADLVSGSVAGLKSENVRIVDNTGRSHRVSEATTVSPEEQIEQIRIVEEFYGQKLHSALGYIDNVVVSVEVSRDKQLPVRATVSVPRSYLLRTAQAGASKAVANPSDAELEKLASAQLAKIQQSAARVVLLPSPSDVKVDWFYDAPSQAQATLASTGEHGIQLTAASVGGCIFVIFVHYLWRRRGERRSEREKLTAAPAASVPAGSELDTSNSPYALSLLRDVDADDLIEFVRGEHPQTVAILLAHLPSSKASAVLGALPATEQSEVARRLAALEMADPEVIREVEQGLATRLEPLVRERHGQLGGVSAVAEILQHSQSATGDEILRSLAGDEPALAESIRSRMFGLDGLVEVPLDQLRPALKSVAAQDLAIALCGADEAVTQKVLSCLSSSTRRGVRAGMSRISPVRLSDVEAAQQAVVRAVRTRQAGEYVANATVRNEVVAAAE